MLEETAPRLGRSFPDDLCASHPVMEPEPSRRDQSPLEKKAKLNPPLHQKNQELQRRTTKQERKASCLTTARSKDFFEQRLQHRFSFIIQDMNSVVQAAAVYQPTDDQLLQTRSCFMSWTWARWVAAAVERPPWTSSQPMTHSTSTGRWCPFENGDACAKKSTDSQA